MTVIVADTSCFIIRHKMSRFNILQRTFKNVLTTDQNVKVPLAAISKTDFRMSEKLYRRLLELANKVD